MMVYKVSSAKFGRAKHFAEINFTDKESTPHSAKHFARIIFTV